MNDELIRQCAREGSDALHIMGNGEKVTTAGSCERAIRLYHARHVTPLVEAVNKLGIALAGAQIRLPDDSDDFVKANAAVGKALAPFRQEARQPKQPLSPEVARLVIAARNVVGAVEHCEEIDELDKAAEAFATRVGWDDAPCGKCDGTGYKDYAGFCMEPCDCVSTDPQEPTHD